jgi:hypothetical protein
MYFVMLLHCLFNYVDKRQLHKVTNLQIQVDDQGKIVDARFKTFGCGSAIASSSLVTEWVKGKSVSEHSASMTIPLLPVLLFCCSVFNFSIQQSFPPHCCFFLSLHGWIKFISWLVKCFPLFDFQINEALTIKNTDIAKELSLPPVKLHCSSKLLFQSDIQ